MNYFCLNIEYKFTLKSTFLNRKFEGSGRTFSKCSSSCCCCCCNSFINNNNDENTNKNNDNNNNINTTTSTNTSTTFTTSTTYKNIPVYIERSLVSFNTVISWGHAILLRV